MFDKLMKWIELILTVMREGLGEKTSLEFLLPHTGQDRQAILKEIDEVAMYHYKTKVVHEDKVRRRFGRTEGQHDADAEDQATAALVQGVVHELSFGELIQGDADEFAAEGSSEEDGSEESSEYDSEYTTGDSEEESSEEEPPPPPPRSATMSRSQSHEQALHAPKRAHGSLLVSPTSKGSLDLSTANRPKPLPRQLRPSRSLNFHAGRSHSPAAPPVPTPQIPQKYLDVPQPLRKPSSSNTAPPPSRSALSSPRPPIQEAITGPSRDKRLPPAPGRRKKVTEQIKPPELHHIPQLLPVFVEMVRSVHLSSISSSTDLKHLSWRLNSGCASYDE